ncbi:TRAP transporter small permease [Aliiruegeria sabulilitoris]|uniref:TRAP transporter small permease n=1 Tax=Aliiruegeria sabulilitoris TaxID=1510458 RepID=UPI000836CA0F|nr:TRAP transporter small permease subunit [Aliiruegeria sabulilitoris]
MLALLRPVCWLNTKLLRVGRSIGWVALAMMVFVILLQVFFRYVLNSALNWPDEAARFLMLWMTGLMAPSAYRWGGFVAIDMLPQALPRVPGLLLSLVILVLSLCVLVIGVQHGYEHTFGFGGKFNSSSLRIPLEWFGMETIKVKLRFMYMSLFICMVLLIAVNVELILRNLILLGDADADLPSNDAPDMLQSAD